MGRNNIFLGGLIVLVSLGLVSCGKKDVEKEIRANEYEFAKQVLYKYANKAYQEIGEKYNKCAEHNKYIGIGNILDFDPLEFFYFDLQKTYFYLTDMVKPEYRCNIKIIEHSITVINKNSAKAKIVIKCTPSPNLDADTLKNFNSVHSEPYEFLVTYTRFGNKWTVENSEMVGTTWQDRPLAKNYVEEFYRGTGLLPRN